MNDRFVSFLLIARWASAIVALMYHLRFLVFVNYDAVHAKTLFSRGFYFVTGLGHESYAVFFIVDGILAGLLLRRHRGTDGAGRAAVAGYLVPLYQILLPSLLIGASFDLAGAHYFGEAGVYTSFPGFSTLSLGFSALFGNLLMLQPFLVPSFGSNSMLYLPSYLFWTFILFIGYLRATHMDQPGRPYLQAALVAGALLAMPCHFLIWAAIWLSGVAVVHLGESRAPRPPLAVAAAAFMGALLLSRLMGSRSSLLPPYADLVIQSGFWLVGFTFAGVAWVLYPQQPQAQFGRLAPSAAASAAGWSAQTASLTFFCHFPVIMLLVSMGATLFGRPLMQQPGAATYAVFALLAAATIGMAAVAARAAASAKAALTLGRALRP